MTTITLRTVTGGTGSTTKGTPLTLTEVDNNFNNLNNDKVETSDAVSTNTANKVVKRDASGDFAAGTITATAISVSGDVNFTGTGAVQMPTGTTAERPSGTTGDFRYNTSTTSFEGYNGTTWGPIGGGATGAGGDSVFMENGQTVTTNYTITTNKNAVSAGPITINSGVTVTVPSGSRWVIV